MQTIEFETQITNGNIQLPDEWKQKLSGSARVIVITENQSAVERGRRLLHEAGLQQTEIAAAATAAYAKMGISGQPIDAATLRARIEAGGVKPEDNEFSRGIIEMREE